MKTRHFLVLLLFVTVTCLFFTLGAGTDWREVFSLRLNRYLQGIFLAAILAYGGRILQTLLLNPLAEPYILGVSSAAALGAVLGVFLDPGDAPGWRSLFSLAAAGGVSVYIYFLSRRPGSFSLSTALLAGVGINALFSSGVMLLQSLLRPNDLQLSIRWLMGSMDAGDPLELGLLGGGAVLVMGYYWLYHRELDIYLSGDETAQASGVDTSRLKRRGFVIVSLGTGLAVSVTGMIGFVGLVVPHVVRMLFGESHAPGRTSLFLVGGVLMILASSLSRVLVTGSIMPVGILTSLLGAPFFIYLLTRVVLPRHQA